MRLSLSKQGIKIQVPVRERVGFIEWKPVPSVSEPYAPSAGAITEMAKPIFHCRFAGNFPCPPNSEHQKIAFDDEFPCQPAGEASMYGPESPECNCQAEMLSPHIPVRIESSRFYEAERKS